MTTQERLCICFISSQLNTMEHLKTTESIFVEQTNVLTRLFKVPHNNMLVFPGSSQGWSSIVQDALHLFYSLFREVSELAFIVV